LLQRQLRIRATQKDFILFSVAGAVLLWFSHPSVFIAAGAGITLFLHYWMTKDRARQMSTILSGLVWGVSLVILYIVNLRHLASSELLLNYWQEGFMELRLGWFASIWQAFLTTPLDFDANYLVVFAFSVIGLGYLIKYNWQLGAVIIIALTLALIASGFHKYSLLGRMLLFIVPLFFIVLSSGIIGIGALFKQRYLSLAVQVLSILYFIWAPIRISLGEFASPTYREHIKPTLQYLSDYKKDNDLIYVYYNTGPAFRFYAPKFGLDNSDYIIGNDYSNEPHNYRDEINSLQGNGRVWLLFSHIYENGDYNERDIILEFANRVATKIREFRVPSTSIYLYFYDFQ